MLLADHDRTSFGVVFLMAQGYFLYNIFILSRCKFFRWSKSFRKVVTNQTYVLLEAIFHLFKVESSQKRCFNHH